jgi:hypothetical protein
MAHCWGLRGFSPIEDGDNSLTHWLRQISLCIDPPVGEARLAARRLAWQSKLGQDLMTNLSGEGARHGEVVHRLRKLVIEHALGVMLQPPACQAVSGLASVLCCKPVVKLDERRRPSLPN